MDKIKENGTFPSYLGYKIRYIPNYALKSSSKCSTHQAASDGTFKFMNIPTQTHTKIREVMWWCRPIVISPAAKSFSLHSTLPNYVQTTI